MRKIGIVGLVLAGALFAGACGGGGGTGGGDAPGVGSVDVDDDGGVTVTDDEGTTTTVGTTLPDGWPSSFPIPDGAEPTWAASTATEGGTSYSALFQSDRSWEELKSFYTETLAADGWSVDTSYDEASGSIDGGPLTVISFRSEEWVGTLILGLQNSFSGEEGDITVSLIPPAALDG